MVQVNTQLTHRDLLWFNYNYFFRRPFVWILAVIICVVFTSTLFDVSSDGLGNYAEAGSFEKMTPAFFLLGIFVFSCWGIYRQTKRNFTSTSTLHEPIVYTFTDAGIHIKGRTFESDLNWEAVHKVKENKKLFLFYQNNLAANLVPKSAFSSNEQMSTLRELIASQPNLKNKLRKD